MRRMAQSKIQPVLLMWSETLVWTNPTPLVAMTTYRPDAYEAIKMIRRGISFDVVDYLHGEWEETKTAKPKSTV